MSVALCSLWVNTRSEGRGWRGVGKSTTCAILSFYFKYKQLGIGKEEEGEEKKRRGKVKESARKFLGEKKERKKRKIRQEWSGDKTVHIK